MRLTVEEIRAKLDAHGLLPLVEQIAKEHDVIVDVLLSRDKHLPIRPARRALYRALRAEKFSYPQIGEMLDRDHSTIQVLVKQDAPESTLRRARPSRLPRCRLCGGIYDEHLAIPPHAMPKRGCVGFTSDAKEAS